MERIDREQRKSGQINKWPFILAGIVVLIVSSVFVVVFFFRVKEIEYYGNVHYTDEQMKQFLFDGKEPNAVFYKLFGDKKKSIPFVQKYDIDTIWPSKMTVTVYEKAMVGYVSYMGCNMYFDKDGMVIESSSETYNGVPEIIGLKFESIVLNQVIKIDNQDVFNKILDMTQGFDKHNLSIDKVYFDTQYNVYLFMGEVKISLGSADNLADKLNVIKSMQSEFEGLKGTLFLDDYNGNQNSIIFKKS